MRPVACVQGLVDEFDLWCGAGREGAWAGSRAGWRFVALGLLRCGSAGRTAARQGDGEEAETRRLERNGWPCD
ncbi:hypothetical protein NDU88_005086 [Pleurodeles waltl]|uniref:Uncharacterized protein n=1 Tax=Pleurodeles waltl TaxID=8319 RepID=A0AAV7RIP4_PLEWA|nr:hypothetical protein NDU88_005086 [Pleurodeles waltl]